MWSGYGGGRPRYHLRLGMQGQVSGLYPLGERELPERRASRISGKHSEFQAG